MQLSGEAYAPLAIGGFWADLNDHLVELVDMIPQEQLDQTPSDGEWSCRQWIAHIAAARYHWMTHAVKDGGAMPRSLFEARTTEELRQHLQDSWQRIAAFIAEPAKLDALYSPPPHDPSYADPERFTGHYIAYHRLAHDIHHRADLLDLLAELGLALPESRRRRPL
jgi:uncharacterized damage-inducible protein DinB